jgi:hypothetical protein
MSTGQLTGQTTFPEPPLRKRELPIMSEARIGAACPFLVI